MKKKHDAKNLVHCPFNVFPSFLYTYRVGIAFSPTGIQIIYENSMSYSSVLLNREREVHYNMLVSGYVS
jgi:hypothetical protein